MKSTRAVEQKERSYTFNQVLQAIEGIAIMIACYLTFFLKPLRDSWGLNKIELKQKFPGDEFVKNPKLHFTHGIEINAPSEMVWPWIAQMGQGRGGFYSYEVLENLVGMNIYNSNEILPQFQKPQVGDRIPFSETDAYPLVLCRPKSAMAIGLAIDRSKNIIVDLETELPSKYIQISWLWCVMPIDKIRSKFISRNRVYFSKTFINKWIIGFIFEPIVFAMDRKMCLGIKKRAEKLYNDIDQKI